MNIRELLEQGQAAKDRLHAEKEKALLGQFRVGSAGCVSDDGEIYGTCHRIALARLMGHDKPVENSQKILFAAGEANEDTWAGLLGLSHKGALLRHSDCAVKHKFEGVDPFLLGHPDIVLGDEQGTPVLGLELKGIYGYTTAISVYYEDLPKNENLIQAATYSMALGIPYALCYTCPSWVKLQYYDTKKYGDKNIKPFYRIYYMKWEEGRMFYRSELKTEWTRTVITESGIEDYYKLLAEMQTTKNLGPRPTSNYVHGQEAKYGPCGLCEFAQACDRYDGNQDFDSWVQSLGDSDV